jgi:hypothetical protein
MIHGSAEVIMVNQTRAGNHLFKYLQKIIPARLILPLLMNVDIHYCRFKRIVHNARDRVPSCISLQIPVNEIDPSKVNDFISN